MGTARVCTDLASVGLVWFFADGGEETSWGETGAWDHQVRTSALTGGAGYSGRDWRHPELARVGGRRAARESTMTSEVGSKQSRRSRSPSTSVILAGLLAVCAVGVYCAGQRNAAPMVWPDACGYLSAARVLATRGTYGLSVVQLNRLTLPEAPELDRIGWWPPLYSLAIALAAGSRMNDPVSLVAAANAIDLAGELLAAAGLGLLVWIAVRNVGAALLTGGLYLFSGPCMSEAPRILSEHLYMALAALAAAVHLVVVKRGGWLPATAAGVLWGLASLTRHWGVIVIACAASASVLALWSVPDRRRKLLAAVVTPAIGWSIWLAWAGRNYLTAGRAGGYYAPGQGPFGEQVLQTVLAYCLGFCANPAAPSVSPACRDFLGFMGAIALFVTLITGGGFVVGFGTLQSGGGAIGAMVHGTWTALHARDDPRIGRLRRHGPHQLPFRTHDDRDLRLHYCRCDCHRGKAATYAPCSRAADGLSGLRRDAARRFEHAAPPRLGCAAGLAGSW